MTNPKWPPHARFHSLAGWGTIAGSQLLGLWLLWRPRQEVEERDLAVKTAAALSALAWLPFLFRVATPGAEVEDEPGQLPPALPETLVNLVPASLIPAVSAVGYALYRHGH